MADQPALDPHRRRRPASAPTHPQPVVAPAPSLRCAAAMASHHSTAWTMSSHTGRPPARRRRGWRATHLHRQSRSLEALATCMIAPVALLAGSVRLRRGTAPSRKPSCFSGSTATCSGSAGHLADGSRGPAGSFRAYYYDARARKPKEGVCLGLRRALRRSSCSSGHTNALARRRGRSRRWRSRRGTRRSMASTPTPAAGPDSARALDTAKVLWHWPWPAGSLMKALASDHAHGDGSEVGVLFRARPSPLRTTGLDNSCSSTLYAAVGGKSHLKDHALHGFSRRRRTPSTASLHLDPLEAPA